MANKSKNSTSKNQDSQVLEVSMPDGFGEFFTPVAVILGAIIVAISVIYAGSKLTKDGTTLGETKKVEQNQETTAETPSGDQPQGPGTVLGSFETFTEYDTDICEEDGKPLVILFSTTWCPHCTWIKDTFDSWAKDNKDRIAAYHWELDTNDNTLTSAVENSVPTEHEEIFNKFNPNGSIPTFVFGCRYSRVGNGYESQDDLGKEKETFNNVVDKLL